MTKQRKEGGKVSDADWDAKEGDKAEDKDTSETYAGKGSNVEKESKGEMRKRGGNVTKSRHERHERKRGGRTENMEGMAAKKRLDRPGRKRGGGVGSDSSPLTTASRTKDRVGGSEDSRSGG
ncbi:hypothetical protein ACELLULO517_07755 [Acidisoma cellulosilytica]|uniref:Uncharacterized protein n=1 Tax=Acidisoma cellulosilyticum TaxID=2802395 RepID=A0A964E364_9PROT|nr:hypothetical protein [Acidisoma cellulosilyticum]MCB8880126.1 hypothetical protein [Acidisoma cellulosilyticum]